MPQVFPSNSSLQKKEKKNPRLLLPTPLLMYPPLKCPHFPEIGVAAMHHFGLELKYILILLFLLLLSSVFIQQTTASPALNDIQALVIFTKNEIKEKKTAHSKAVFCL